MQRCHATSNIMPILWSTLLQTSQYQITKTHAQPCNSGGVANSIWQRLLEHGTGWQQNGSEGNTCKLHHDTQLNSTCTGSKQILYLRKPWGWLQTTERVPPSFNQLQSKCIGAHSKLRYRETPLEQCHTHCTCEVHVPRYQELLLDGCAGVFWVHENTTYIVPGVDHQTVCPHMTCLK
jgi:hypothetical protein